MIDLYKLYEKGLFEKLTAPSQVEILNFPVEIFPAKIQEIIETTHEAVFYPNDYTASSILFACSVALGNTIKLRTKKTFINQATIFIAIIGNAGAVKSHPLKFPLAPLEEEDKKNFYEYKQDLKKYEVVLDMTKAQRIENKVSDDTKPILTQILIDDITPESLLSTHQNNKRGLGLYKDELISWIKDMNRYNSGSEQELWLKIWSGGNAKINRLSREVNFITNTFISVAGTIQPSVLATLAQGGRNDNGFMNRILFAYPPNSKKANFSDTEIPDELINNYSEIIQKIMNIETEYDEFINIKSKVIEYSSEAYNRFKEWFDFNASLINSFSDNDHPIKSIFTKFDLYISRLALILQTLFYASDNETIGYVGLKSVEGAIKLVEYFRMSAVKVYLTINAENNQLDKLSVNDRILKYHKQGKSKVEIGKLEKLSEGTIRNRLKKLEKWS